MDTQLKYWAALSLFPKFGPIRFKKLINYFPDMQKAFFASARELAAAGIEEKIAEEFAAARASINPEALMQKLAAENIKIITIKDKNYPKLLSQIYDPPPLFYLKGELLLEDEFSIGVVGSRKFTHYGKQAVEKIVSELSRNNLVIVSGLALGIDALAHCAAVDAGGRTIAVLGSGLDKQSIYPSDNRYIAEKIIFSGGAVISEFPPGTAPLRHNFPQRNRVISGLTLGTLVVEAAEKSGALITARCALEQNREVFAVPGNIYSSVSIGPNRLIQLGAKAVTCAKDIIETLDLAQVAGCIEVKKTIPESDEEKTICSCLSHEPAHIDELVRLTKLDINIMNSTLAIMELKGMVRNIGGMRYIIL